MAEYQRLICEKYSDSDIKNIVNPANRKKEIKNPTKEQIKRRAYIIDSSGLNKTELDLISG